MSGGSYDYIYRKIEDASNQLRTNNDPRRVAFAKLLKLIADAMHDIEWVDSCDYGPGDEHKAIDKVFMGLGIDPEEVYMVEAYKKIRGLVREREASRKPLP